MGHQLGSVILGVSLPLPPSVGSLCLTPTFAQGSAKQRNRTRQQLMIFTMSFAARLETRRAAALPSLGTTRAVASQPTHLHSRITQRYELPISECFVTAADVARFEDESRNLCLVAPQATSARVRPDFCVIYSFLAGVFDTDAPPDNAGQVERLRSMRPVDRITTVTLCHNLSRNLTSQRMWCACSSVAWKHCFVLHNSVSSSVTRARTSPPETG